MRKYVYDLRYEIDKTEWRSRAKRDLVYTFWEKYCSSSTHRNVQYLDVGCGTGVLQEEFEQRYPGITAYGIDMMKEAIDYCKKRGLDRAILYDGCTIPFKDGELDLITAIDVLEHIEDDIYSLKEIKRVLKKDSLAIFIVPAHMALHSTRDIKLEHYRRYEDNELERKCEATGFRVMTSKNVDFSLYFVLRLLCKMTPRNSDGVPELGMEAVQAPWLLNEIMYGYEYLENTWLRFANFPIGISKLVVVKS